MADPRSQIHALMRGMVKRHFRTDQSAAKEMADYWHPTGNAGDDFDTSDLSRKMAGSRRWAIEDAVALAAITGSRRIIEVQEAVLKGSETCEDTLSLLAHAKRLIKEGGEGQAALIEAEQGGCLDEAEAQLVDIAEATARALAAVRAKRGAA